MNTIHRFGAATAVLFAALPSLAQEPPAGTVPPTAEKSPPAKEKGKTQSAQDPSTWLPMKTGAAWKWRFQSGDNEPVDMEWQCVRRVRVDKAGKEQAWELRMERGRYQSWEYWDVRPDGIYTYENQYLGNMRGVSRSQKPTRMVPGPIGVTTMWQWTRIGSVQTEGDAEYPSKDELRMSYTGRIESLDEKVKVPAGDFTAMRIGIKMQSSYFGNTQETIWFARGVGIVKRVIENAAHQNRQTQELTSFKPGPDVKVDPLAQIQDLLATDRVCVRLGKPHSLKLVENRAVEMHVGSVFHMARWKDHTVFFRSFGGKSSVFHPSKTASWQGLIADEMGESVSHQEGAALTNVYGILWKLYDAPDSEPIVYKSERTLSANGHMDMKVWIRKKTDKNPASAGWARMTFKKNQLDAIQSNLVPQKVAIGERDG